MQHYGQQNANVVPQFQLARQGTRSVFREGTSSGRMPNVQMDPCRQTPPDAACVWAARSGHVHRVLHEKPQNAWHRRGTLKTGFTYMSIECAVVRQGG